MSDEGVKELRKKLNKLAKEYTSLDDPVFVRSGSVSLDAVLGGGVPRGTVITWASDSGCGKTTGALHISKVYCLQGLRVLYLDYEHGVNKNQIDGIGLTDYLYHNTKNPDGNFILYQVQTYKDGEKILDELMSEVDLVIIDSVTSILLESMKTKSVEDATIGVDARAQSNLLKKYKASVHRLGCTWIIINQMRTKIETGYGKVTMDKAAGGNALKFYPDIRLMMKKAYQGELVRTEETVKGAKKIPFGAINTLWAEKNRYERPFIPMNIAIIFGHGIDNSFSYYDFLENQGAIKKTGAWYSINVPGTDCPDKLQGMNKVIEWIGSHKDAVRDFINSKGGFRLLMNEKNPVDIQSEHADVAIFDEGSGEKVFDTMLDPSESEKSDIPEVEE